MNRTQPEKTMTKAKTVRECRTLYFEKGHEAAYAFSHKLRQVGQSELATYLEENEIDPRFLGPSNTNPTETW